MKVPFGLFHTNIEDIFVNRREDSSIGLIIDFECAAEGAGIVKQKED